MFNINSSFSEIKSSLIKEVNSTSFFDEFSLKKRSLIINSSQSLLKLINTNGAFTQSERIELLDLNQKWVVHVKGGLISNAILRLFGQEDSMKEIEPSIQKLELKMSKARDLITKGYRKEKLYREEIEIADFALGIELQKKELKRALMRGRDENFDLKIYGPNERYSLQNLTEEGIELLVDRIFKDKKHVALQRFVPII